MENFTTEQHKRDSSGKAIVESPDKTIANLREKQRNQNFINGVVISAMALTVVLTGTLLGATASANSDLKSQVETLKEQNVAMVNSQKVSDANNYTGTSTISNTSNRDYNYDNRYDYANNTADRNYTDRYYTSPDRNRNTSYNNTTNNASNINERNSNYTPRRTRDYTSNYNRGNYRRNRTQTSSNENNYTETPTPVSYTPSTNDVNKINDKMVNSYTSKPTSATYPNKKEPSENTNVVNLPRLSSYISDITGQKTKDYKRDTYTSSADISKTNDKYKPTIKNL